MANFCCVGTVQANCANSSQFSLLTVICQRSTLRPSSSQDAVRPSAESAILSPHRTENECGFGVSL
jgi:hypothetical protein